MKRASIHNMFMLIALLAFSCNKGNYVTKPVAVYNFSSIDKLLQDSVPVRFGGHCYALIAVDGKTVYSKGFGGYDGNTVAQVASCTKWLSAAVVMSLVDKGELSLSDTIGKFLPEFTRYHKGNISIAQLLSHTSGFPGSSAEDYEDNQSLTLRQCVDSIAKNVPLVATPGREFYYGGVSMQIAGRVCEVITGQTWNNLFNATVAIPCGMKNTNYGLTKNPLIAGGARSTPNDYSSFLYMLVDGGISRSGYRVLSPDAISLMEQGETSRAKVAFTPYPISLLHTDNFYGIGNWRDVTTPADSLLEESSPGAFGSHPWINRSKKITGIIFTYMPDEGYTSTIQTCLKVRTIARDMIK